MTPQVHDLLLHAGIERVQRNVLNYFRDDLDYPIHSARAIVSLTSSMLSFMDEWDLEAAMASVKLRANTRELLSLWSTQLKG